MILSMPKVEKVPSSRRDSNTIAAAAGGGTRTAPWSQKDDETLMAARTQGLNWNQIAPKYFPTKTSNACRKRHERLMEKQNAEQWDGVKLDELAQAYMEVRREMWSILASRVNEKWALVEQKCMEKGLKNLNQAYRASQRRQGTYEGNDDSGFGHSDPEEDPENPSPVLTEASNHLAMPYMASGGYVPTTRVPSIHSILQQPMSLAQQPMGYPAHAYAPQH